MHITKERKAELVEWISEVLNHTDLLKSQSTSRQFMAGSAWAIVDQLLQVVGSRIQDPVARREKFYQFIRELPKQSKATKINENDLKKVQEFLMRKELRGMSHDELRFVIGWTKRMTVRE